jgi:rod shape-determining protein MreC
MEKKRNKQKQTTLGYSKILPAVFIVLSLFVIILPLQMPVNSTRAVLSYIFIPQIRAAHAVTQYLDGVSSSAAALLTVAEENAALKKEIKDLKIQNAQTDILLRENQRLTSALDVYNQNKWKGAWAKVMYREPSKRGTIIADKGSENGIELRSPVVAIENGEIGLVGKVIEVSPKTSKILLTSDEDFSATAFLSVSGIEGLAGGNGRGGVDIKYIPLATPLQEGEKVYTSASSALFPDGILMGSLSGVEAAQNDPSVTFLKPSLKLAVDPAKVKEILIMRAVYETPKTKGGKK